ncbi:hypothetical protein JET76_23490 [Pseudomonas putida]|uniref:hypothetical protein n=1 Tax=Pseudomonas TaxID=286 RepID=UPI0006D48365|nr:MULTISPECIES: hypothetical protein [Pseudomonas]MBI6944293.1 hypothetical protein [Pseudomonas putida]MBI6960391.1 hypothetical protein [Pseudomonas putida]PZQ38340.1 MAG: hypothetical protein DI560_17840 [Pseudomonas putida]
MRKVLLVLAVAALGGCASAAMDTARGGKPTAQLASQKAPELVAQCIQFSWQKEDVFGEDASGYLEPRKQGGLTVYTREAESFVDVYPQAGGTRVDYYAQKNDGVALQRRAAAATCL